LVGYNVIFVFRVDRLVLRWQVDGVWVEGQAGEFFEEVGVGAVVEVEVCAGGVARLLSSISLISLMEGRERRTIFGRKVVWWWIWKKWVDWRRSSCESVVLVQSSFFVVGVQNSELHIEIFIILYLKYLYLIP
jgi:hypothetical protein